MRTALALILVLASAAAVRGDEIVLRATARLAPSVDATLADIADLVGPGAEALGGTVIVPASELGAGWVDVGIERARSVLEARGDVAWGMIALRGSICSVGRSASPEPKPNARPELVGPAGEPADTLGPETVKGRIAAKIAGALGVEATKLRLTFDERDEDVLSMRTAGRVVEARLTGTSDQMPVRVTVFESERLLVSRSMGVGTLVQRQVAVTRKAVRRGEVIDGAHLAAEERWVGPALASVPPQEAAGSAAKAALNAGQVVTVNDLQAPVVIKRGDLVTVSSIAGGVIVRTTARARSAARDGEVVDLESLDGDRKKRRTFTARACGRGQAVVAAGAMAPESETER